MTPGSPREAAERESEIRSLHAVGSGYCAQAPACPECVLLREIDALRAALASPPEPLVAFGKEIRREAANLANEYEFNENLCCVDLARRIAKGIRALPVEAFVVERAIPAPTPNPDAASSSLVVAAPAVRELSDEECDRIRKTGDSDRWFRVLASTYVQQDFDAVPNQERALIRAIASALHAPETPT